VTYVVLRYFNVAGADPMARIGLATVGATHLLKVAVEAATGQRAKVDVYGMDYPTPDGSCIRDFVHVSDLAEAHRAALSYLRGGGASITLNCGYGRGYSVLETIEAVRRVSGSHFAVSHAPRRPGDVMTMVADANRIRATFDWTPAYDNLDTIAAHALAWRKNCCASAPAAHWLPQLLETIENTSPYWGLKNPHLAGKEAWSARRLGRPGPARRRPRAGWPSFRRKSPTIPMAQRS